MPCAPAPALGISPEDRRELLQVVGLRSVPQSVALRARIVLGAAEGIGNKVLARQLATSFRRSCFGGAAIRQRVWWGFWKIGLVPAGRRRSLRSRRRR